MTFLSQSLPTFCHLSGKDISLMELPNDEEVNWWWTVNNSYNPRGTLYPYTHDQLSRAHKIGAHPCPLMKAHEDAKPFIPANMRAVQAAPTWHRPGAHNMVNNLAAHQQALRNQQFGQTNRQIAPMHDENSVYRPSPPRPNIHNLRGCTRHLSQLGNSIGKLGNRNQGRVLKPGTPVGRGASRHMSRKPSSLTVPPLDPRSESCPPGMLRTKRPDPPDRPCNYPPIPFGWKDRGEIDRHAEQLLGERQTFYPN